MGRRTKCDPIKSTQAALAYLKAANRTYDDWLVSLASYNAGPETNRPFQEQQVEGLIGIFNLNYHVRRKSMSQSISLWSMQCTMQITTKFR